MVVATSDQFYEHGRLLPVAPAVLFPSYLVYCAHCMERQGNVRNDVREHFLSNPQRWDTFRDKMVSPFQIVSSNDNRVNSHPVVSDPYLSLRFKSFEEDRCAQTLHPEHDVGVFCQVSLLSSQWLVSAIQRLEHMLQSWDAQSVLERLSCKSCDYVRTTSNTQPKVSLEKRRNGDETRIEVVITT